MEQVTKRITDLIYTTYGSDTGILFGISNRMITEEIIRFTLRYIERHKNDQEVTSIFQSIKNHQ